MEELHVTKEFLEWRERSNWPPEHSPEYQEARKRKGWAPSFSALGKARDAGMVVTGLGNLAVWGFILYTMLTGSAGV